MKKGTCFFSGLLACLFLWCSGPATAGLDPEQTIWFTYPATDWKTQCLHLGNGYMGLSFYGGVESERFDLAEESFWTGGPNVFPEYNYGIIPGGKEVIGSIREKIRTGRVREADSLAQRHMMGDSRGTGYFSKVGSLFLDFPVGKRPVTQYERGIDLSRALGFVAYRQDSVLYEREYFCSYPDRLAALRFSADSAGRVSFGVRAELLYGVTDRSVVNGNEWVINGRIDGNGLNYCVRLRLVSRGGVVTCGPDVLSVRDADEATLYYTVATEYRPVGPLFRGADPVAMTRQAMDRAVNGEYGVLRERHVSDYASLYDRVVLHLTGDTALERLPTDQRIAQLKRGSTDDSALKTLWFNLGRYAVISASRPGTLPSNLQGVWNTFEMAPWNGNYQSNINLQMMYWACGPTNLPECQQAYIDWIGTLVEPGRRVAQAYYGSPGWVSHATGNIWGFASPGSDLMWGLYPMAAAWHCRHLWDQYDFTGNRDYLRKTAYPIMKEAARFYLANLVMGPGGYYFAPSGSAEHGVQMNGKRPADYSTVSGESNAGKVYLAPNFQDIEMVYDLFSNVIAAGEVLETDVYFLDQVRKMRQQLMPLQVGKYGQLQEWLVDVDNPRDHHRHIAHLYGLYPGNQITALKTPELFRAARVSLDMRGDGAYLDRWPHSGGNWSMAWRMACRARLLEGERAIGIFNDMICYSGYENMMSSQSGHMMVDAMMATPALFTELLVQSHDRVLHLLPALPAEWPAGEIHGVVARGGYRVSLSWQNGQLTEVLIRIRKGSRWPELRLKGEPLPVTDSRVRIQEI